MTNKHFKEGWLYQDLAMIRLFSTRIWPHLALLHLNLVIFCLNPLRFGNIWLSSSHIRQCLDLFSLNPTAFFFPLLRFGEDLKLIAHHCFFIGFDRTGQSSAQANSTQPVMTGGRQQVSFSSTQLKRVKFELSPKLTWNNSWTTLVFTFAPLFMNGKFIYLKICNYLEELRTY